MAELEGVSLAGDEVFGTLEKDSRFRIFFPEVVAESQGEPYFRVANIATTGATEIVRHTFVAMLDQSNSHDSTPEWLMEHTQPRVKTLLMDLCNIEQPHVAVCRPIGDDPFWLPELSYKTVIGKRMQYGVFAKEDVVSKYGVIVSNVDQGTTLPTHDVVLDQRIVVCPSPLVSYAAARIVGEGEQNYYPQLRELIVNGLASIVPQYRAYMDGVA